LSKRRERTIIEEWNSIKSPSAPNIRKVAIGQNTALLILDIQYINCTDDNRPRFVQSLPKIQRLLTQARNMKLPIIYSLTRNGELSDIRKEVKPLTGEYVVKSSVDKFYDTNLERLLKTRHIDTVILVGTSAHGAILHTATGAAIRGFNLIVPLDCISAEDPYAEQYTAWHLANSPGTRKRTILTITTLIQFH
jgi:nicotinamidase-related amidase